MRCHPEERAQRSEGPYHSICNDAVKEGLAATYRAGIPIHIIDTDGLVRSLAPASPPPRMTDYWLRLTNYRLGLTSVLESRVRNKCVDR